MWYLLTLILVCLHLADYLLTASLMRFAGVEVESNPLARHVCEHLGMSGMLMFKISVVALVVTIMQVVKIRRPVTAWGMQLGFCGLMMAVVAYNTWLVRFCLYAQTHTA